MKQKIMKVVKGIVIGVLLLILILNVYIMIQVKAKPNSVPSIFGYKPFIVLSGSMETEIYIGDLVFVKNVDAKSLKENDIIAFRDAENFVVTHRIIKVLEDSEELCFQTKGDNNNAPDH